MRQGTQGCAVNVTGVLALGDFNRKGAFTHTACAISRSSWQTSSTTIRAGSVTAFRPMLSHVRQGVLCRDAAGFGAHSYHARRVQAAVMPRREAAVSPWAGNSRSAHCRPPVHGSGRADSSRSPGYDPRLTATTGSCWAIPDLKATRTDAALATELRPDLLGANPQARDASYPE
jgi:hypothetical protein